MAFGSCVFDGRWLEWSMVSRSLVRVIAFCGLVISGTSTGIAEAKIFKVLPHFLDQEGRHALSPSLFERDAYQRVLSQNPERQSGMRFDVLWRVDKKQSGGVELHIEMTTKKGDPTKPIVIKAPVKRSRWFRKWSAVNYVGKDFRDGGEVLAWRALLIKDGKILDSQQSFLW